MSFAGGKEISFSARINQGIEVAQWSMRRSAWCPMHFSLVPSTILTHLTLICRYPWWSMLKQSNSSEEQIVSMKFWSRRELLPYQSKIFPVSSDAKVQASQAQSKMISDGQKTQRLKRKHQITMKKWPKWGFAQIESWPRIEDDQASYVIRSWHHLKAGIELKS